MKRASRWGALVGLALLAAGVTYAGGGADSTSARGPDDSTPLHWAAYRGDAAAVRALLAAGADPRQDRKSVV